MKSTHVFSHLLTSKSIYSLNFFGHSPSEFPQKYTQSSSGSTSRRSAKLTENNVNFIKGKSCPYLHQGKMISLNYIKGKLCQSTISRENYVTQLYKGKITSKSISCDKQKAKNLEYYSEIQSKTQSIMHLLYKRKASTISQILLLGRSFILG